MPISSTRSTRLPSAARAPTSSPCTTSRSQRDPGLMGRKDRIVFRRVVPRAVRSAARVVTVSERTKTDILELYAVPAERVVVTPNGVDPALPRRPGTGVARLRAVAWERSSAGRTSSPLSRPRRLPGFRSSSSGRRRIPSSRRSCASAAPGSRATSRRSGSSISTAVRRVWFSRAGTRASGSRCSRPWPPELRSSRCRIPALREVAGDAAIFVEEDGLADGIRRALGERDRLVAAGLERARAFSWRAAAERTLAVYREILET